MGNKLVKLILFLPYSFLVLTSCETNKGVLEIEYNKNLDTTSHEFTWRIDTIGIRCILLDVAVVDEDNIWVVGEIHTNETDVPDTNGLTVPPYNAVHWDGYEWDLVRFNYMSGGFERIILPIQGIHYVNHDDIWLAAGSIFHFDGDIASISFSRNMQTSEIAQKFFVSSATNLYCVGKYDMIVQYTGSAWQRIYSGTNLDINDIWGSQNEETGEMEILCVASNQFTREGRKIMKIQGNVAVTLNSDSLPNSLSSIWFISGKEYFVCGDGLYKTKKLGNNWKRIQNNLPPFYISEIRGPDTNDFFVTGHFGLLSHYNGSTWRHYSETELSSLSNTVLGSIWYDGSFFVTVGDNGYNGIIVTGKRIRS
jgi:hypothetical protein